MQQWPQIGGLYLRLLFKYSMSFSTAGYIQPFEGGFCLFVCLLVMRVKSMFTLVSDISQFLVE
jgi:hypothetical protein